MSTTPDDAQSLWFEAMGAALAMARAAGESGEVPVGALVLDGEGAVVAVAGNERESTCDPSAHAEIVALRAAAALRGSWRLDGYTLVVTLEPCAMCAGAVLHSRISRVVFGAPSLDNGALGSLYNFAADPRLSPSCEVVAGLRSDESTELLQLFFESRRSGSA